MTCSSSSPSTSTSGTSGTSSSSCSSGMKRSCEDSRSTDSVCMIDSPLAIKQEEEEEISQKLKMTKVDDRSTRLVSRCSRVMDSLAREIKLVDAREHQGRHPSEARPGPEECEGAQERGNQHARGPDGHEVEVHCPEADAGSKEHDPPRQAQDAHLPGQQGPCRDAQEHVPPESGLLS